MWEADKDVLRAYQQCYSNLLSEMREGGDVDLSEACKAETKQLQNAANKAVAYYKNNNPMVVTERKQAFYNPKIPYFQNM